MRSVLRNCHVCLGADRVSLGVRRRGELRYHIWLFTNSSPSPQPPAALPRGTVGPDVFTPKTQWFFLEIVLEGLLTAAILHRCIPWGPRDTLGGFTGQNNFPNNIETFFVFFILIL